jgi:hypothetical protein
MPTKGEGVSAFGFKACGGGQQSLEKWDKGTQAILATDSHPAALAIYEGDLKLPVTEEEAEVTAAIIWDNYRTTAEL